MMSVNKEPIRNHIYICIWALSPVSHLIIGIVIQASKMTELVMHIEVHPASFASYPLPQVPSIFTYMALTACHQMNVPGVFIICQMLELSTIES